MENLADRLADVVVTIRCELEVSRNVFGAEIHYVFRDPITSMTHSFGPGDYEIIAELDGKRPLSEIFTSLCGKRILRRDDEDNFYRLILKVHQARLINLPVPDHRSLYENYRARKEAGTKKRFTGFLFMQIPLCTPDGFLSSTLPAVRFVFSRTFFRIWCALMGFMLYVIYARWGDLENPLPALFDQSNLFFIWFSLVGLKLIHEFGHGWACKHFGGTVPEMGVFMIVGTPSAYVDVSSSWGFPDRKQRLTVSLAGMYFESLVAIPALLFWAFAPPSAATGMAYQIFLLSTIVTIAFNANPLMRFDGYFILSDLLGIPNLRGRATSEVGRRLDRILLGVRRPPQPGPGGVLLSYGIAATIYKVTLVLGICALIAGKFYWLGIAMMIFYLVTSLGGSLVKSFKHLVFNQTETMARRRGIAVATALVIGVPLALGMVKIGLPVSSRGVLEGETQVLLRAPGDGFIASVPSRSGAAVTAGMPLVILSNDEASRLERVEAARRDLSLTTFAASLEAGGTALMKARSSLAADEARYRHVLERAERLELLAPKDGRLVSLDARSRLGSWVQEGEPLGQIESGRPVIRLFLQARQIADSGVKIGDAVACRPVMRPQMNLSGIVRSVAPLGTRKISNEALTQLGGGDIAVRADTGEAERSYFEVLVEMDSGEILDGLYGASFIVRLNAESQSLGTMAYRAIVEFTQSLATGS